MSSSESSLGGLRTDVDSVLRKLGRIMGTEQEGLETVYSACERELRKILADPEHPLNELNFTDFIIPRCGRMRLATATTNRYQRSIVPRAMKMFNTLML